MRPSSGTSESQNEAASGTAGDSPSGSLQQLAELRAYLAFYLSTVADRIKGTIRSLIVWLVLGVVAVIAITALVIVAEAQVLSGIAGGLAQTMPSHPWLGNLITGLSALALAVLTTWIVVRAGTSSIRNAVRAKYLALKHQQERQFGRNAEQVARDAEEAGHG